VRLAQKKALERVSQLETENAQLREAAERRSVVLQQSRNYINAFLEVSAVLSESGLSVSRFFGLVFDALSCPAVYCCFG
jgi:ribulose kinase